MVLKRSLRNRGEMRVGKRIVRGDSPRGERRGSAPRLVAAVEDPALVQKMIDQEPLGAAVAWARDRAAAWR